ncbi:MAG: hypothetical protein CVV28_03010 [Methanobacteriales archaeon HGW-Methanobacteriales-1]|jgi:mRNA-degrading endonuclease RelE of RelBE toxin-antitoxin system|nr:MAG: hypothetical protein CVV28_03010 [Methanobacteriales archaeon HGW-Methanobacteriales-1]
MYNIKISPELLEELENLQEKDSKSYQNIVKKVQSIANILELNPNHCKNLRKPFVNSAEIVLIILI